MTPRPTHECCHFGRIFGPDEDHHFANLSVREAHRYFESRCEGKLARWSVERHRGECLGLRRDAPKIPEALPVPPEEAIVVDLAFEQVKNVIDKDKEDKGEAYVGQDKFMEAMNAKEKREVGVIAAIVDTNQWEGHKTVLALQQKFKLELPEVYERMKAARVHLASARGGVLFDRHVSIAKTREIRDKAMEKEDLKSAIAAQKHLDSITGVLAAAPAIQVNQINQSSTVESAELEAMRIVGALMNEIADELMPFPDALAAVTSRVERWFGEMRGATAKKVVDMSDAM